MSANTVSMTDWLVSRSGEDNDKYTEPQVKKKMHLLKSQAYTLAVAIIHLHILSIYSHAFKHKQTNGNQCHFE